MWPEGSSTTEAYLLGVLSSVILDWQVRRSVELNLTYHILYGLCVPRPALGQQLAAKVVEISGRLAAIDKRYSEWAEEVGVAVGSVTDESTKDDLIAELDALVALLYGLDESQVTHIFETFHRGWDYKPRLEAVLKHFNSWKDKK